MLKKSGTKIPCIELEEIGPSADLSIRRTKLASADLFKTACRTPVQAKVDDRKSNIIHQSSSSFLLQPKKVKNISKDVFGTKMGRIHMPRQDFKKLQVKRGRALRPEKKSKATKS